MQQVCAEKGLESVLTMLSIYGCRCPEGHCDTLQVTQLRRGRCGEAEGCFEKAWRSKQGRKGLPRLGVWHPSLGD